MTTFDYTKAYLDKKAQQFAQLLYGVLFFNIFTREELCSIVRDERLISWKKFEKRDRIFEQGSADPRFYIVIQGKIDIRIKDEAQKETTAAVIQKGGVFGEMAVCDPKKPRRASACVTSDESAIVCEVDAALIGELPGIIRTKFFKKVLDLIIERISLSDGIFRYYEDIIQFAEKNNVGAENEYFTYALQTAANERNRLTHYIKYTDFLIANKIPPDKACSFLQGLVLQANSELDKSFHSA